MHPSALAAWFAPPHALHSTGSAAGVQGGGGTGGDFDFEIEFGATPSHKLFSEYRDNYDKTRDKLRENPHAKQFEFNESVIFSGCTGIEGEHVE